MHHVVQPDDRDERGRLEHHQPVVGEARNRVADHLRQQDVADHLPAAEPAGMAGLDLASRDGEDGAAEGFGKVGAEDEAERQRSGDEGVDVDVAPALRIGERD